MVMICNCMYVCVFNFVVFTSHMFLICLPLIVFSLCRRNVTHHYAMSVLISDKRSPGVFILCFRNVTRYLTITELISTKPLHAGQPIRLPWDKTPTLCTYNGYLFHFHNVYPRILAWSPLAFSVSPIINIVWVPGVGIYDSKTTQIM